MAEPVMKEGISYYRDLISGKGHYLMLICQLVLNLEEHLISPGRFCGSGGLDEDVGVVFLANLV
jgi:hypothetical protein